MKVATAALYGFLLTLFPSSLYMLFSIAEANIRHTNVNTAISNAFLAGLIAWGMATFLVHQLLSYIEETNNRDKANKE